MKAYMMGIRNIPLAFAAILCFGTLASGGYLFNYWLLYENFNFHSKTSRFWAYHPPTPTPVMTNHLVCTKLDRSQFLGCTLTISHYVPFLAVSDFLWLWHHTLHPTLLTLFNLLKEPLAVQLGLTFLVQGHYGYYYELFTFGFQLWISNSFVQEYCVKTVSQLSPGGGGSGGKQKTEKTKKTSKRKFSSHMFM